MSTPEVREKRSARLRFTSMKKGKRKEIPRNWSANHREMKRAGVVGRKRSSVEESVVERMTTILSVLDESAKDRRKVMLKHTTEYDALPGKQKRKFLKDALRRKEGTLDHPHLKHMAGSERARFNAERRSLGMKGRGLELKSRMARIKKSGNPMHK